MKNETNIFKNIDRTMVFIYLLLVMLGWANIYAAVYDEQHSNILDFTQSYGKQALFILGAFALALLILLTDVKFFSAFSYVFYGVVIFLLIAVLLVGKEISGSKSWFQIGGFGLQPAELMKFAASLAIAKFMSQLDFDRRKLRNKMIPLGLLALPALLILLQNDTGSALVFAAFVLVFYREGMPGAYLLLGLAVVVLAIASMLIKEWWIIGALIVIYALMMIFIRRSRKNIVRITGIFAIAILFSLSVDYAFENILEPHQKTRINVLLGKEIDLKKAGYNVNQSKIAIGSGGFFGKGYLKGTQTKYNFVPEQSTDFIFCTVGEEWGFVGSSLVLGLFLWLLIRIVLAAERQRSSFARIYGYSVASILFFHLCVNIGMTIGLMPVIGIPLPFFSYGGSSLWAFTILLFIFIKQDSNRLQLV